jgi:hypothetical protein
MILGAAVSFIGFSALAASSNDDDRPTTTDERTRSTTPPTYDSPTAAPSTTRDDTVTDDRSAAQMARDRANQVREADREATNRRRPPSWIGIGFEAGGGVGGFFDSKASGVNSASGLWQVRAIVGTRSHFAGEMAYVGGASTLNTFGVSNDATLTTNGFEGAVRWNVLTGVIQPYAAAGLGYQHYSLGDAQISTSDVSSGGEVMTFPLALGLAWKPGAFMIDGRVSFHPATKSAILRDTNMSTWDVGAHAGFEF